MPSQYIAVIRFTSSDEIADFIDEVTAVERFLYHGSRHQEHEAAVVGTIIARNTECVSESGLHEWSNLEYMDGLSHCVHCPADNEEE